MFLVHLAAAFVGSVLYCSLLEWGLHKHFMHSTRFMREPFERHAVQHHGMHRSGRSFFADVREQPEYMLVEASFFPLFWVLHLPVFAAFEFLVARGSGFGIALGTAGQVGCAACCPDAGASISEPSISPVPAPATFRMNPRRARVRQPRN